jgi:uncharacterized membrane protein YjfL (UPF0719 family)
MEPLLAMIQAAGSVEDYLPLKGLVQVAVYSVLGLILFVGGFIVLDKCTPGDLWKEVLEQKNTAVAVMIGSLGIAFAIIIAAAIHG